MSEELLIIKCKCNKEEGPWATSDLEWELRPARRLGWDVSYTCKKKLETLSKWVLYNFSCGRGSATSFILSKGQDETSEGKKKKEHRCVFESSVGERLPVTFLLWNREAKKGNCGSIVEINGLTVRLYPGFPVSFPRERMHCINAGNAFAWKS